MLSDKAEAARPRRRRTPKRWGLLDMEDRVWLGDDEGPSLFADEQLAQLAAEVWTLQLEWPNGRVKAHRFTETGPLHMRDEVASTDAGIERARALLSAAVHPEAAC